ncbi:MAG: AtpZ/AtpI family protein [Sphingomicrobium sp.]
MAEDESGQVPASPQDARLTSLEERLKRAEQVEAGRTAVPVADSAVRSTSLRLMQSLVGVPLGALLIGWFLDRLFGTAPWIMLAMLFLGFGGAFVDVMRQSKQGPDGASGK